ncbi:MAG: hypothetical protein NZM38_08735 [Cytophagales bacterium]|nr:hypothetical protein [Cytophagales bacterium]MDW8384844.1 hypothetical protein [Flammeovirgaceae bacterium]
MKKFVLFYCFFQFYRVGISQTLPHIIPIDFQDSGRMFLGICGVNAGGCVGRLLPHYPEPQRSQILDLLFKPYYGASLHAYKAEIGGDYNSTEGAEPSHARFPEDRNFQRGFQWWFMKEAKKRNPNIQLYALAWNYPSWLGEVNSEATVNYLIDYLKGAKQQHGLEIDYIGIWNETKVDYRFIKLLKKKIIENGLKTKIIADDLVNWWAIADSMMIDKELYDAVDIVSTHYPVFQSSETAKRLGKPLCASEDGPWGDEWGISGRVSAPLAKLLNRNYIEGKITSTHIWNMVSAYYDVLELPRSGLLRAMSPWSGHYEPMSGMWVVAHTTQFSKIGWYYADNACGYLPKGGSYVTLHDRKKHFSTIFETLDAADTQTVVLRVPAKVRKIYVWQTTPSEYFQKIATLCPKDQQVTFKISPNAVYTFSTTTGQRKGSPPPPPLDTMLALPYEDDFEAYSLGNTLPKYFIEQNGSYEIHRAPQREGKCLRQVVNTHAIPWIYGKDSYRFGTLSIIGDRRWNNYAVSADVFLEEKGYASVVARLSSSSSDGIMRAYQLRLYDDGTWKLLTGNELPALDSGNVSSALLNWRKLRLECEKNRIRAFIDNTKVTEIEDKTHVYGLAGIGNDFNKGCYDNFKVEPLEGVPVVMPDLLAGYYAEYAPETPTLYIPNPSEGKVRLAWSKVENAAGYKIAIGTEENKFDNIFDVGNKTEYTVWTLSQDKTYWFYVIAYNSKGESAPSNKMQATIGRDVPTR